MKLPNIVACVFITLAGQFCAFANGMDALETQFPPVSSVQGAAIYKTGTNSVPDKQGVERNNELLAPILDFMSYLAKVLDGDSDQATRAQAYTILRHWAQSGALLQKPEGSAGTVARVWITTGFGLLILKFQMNGVALTPDITNWYSQLAGAVFNDYREPLKKGSYAGKYSNTYPWAAASEAIAVLLNNDPEALHNEDTAWGRMIDEIQPNGTLLGELGRGQRALEYHIRTVDGLLILRKVRHAIGRHDRPDRLASLNVLLNTTGDAICDPNQMAKLAGTPQEPPSEALFRIAFPFGKDILPASWARCRAEPPTWGSGEYGGDARLAVKAIEFASKQKSQ